MVGGVYSSMVNSLDCVCEGSELSLCLNNLNEYY